LNSYDSFGNPTNPTFPSRYQFTGREFDSYSGLQFSRARFYDPNLGRFISEDPIGFGGGDVNLYGYVWTNPLNYYDPMGLDGWPANLANWFDENIEYARQFYQGDEQDWQRNGSVNTVADLASGAADMLRCGSGAGQAYFSTDENIYGRGALAAMDVARCAALAAALLGPLSKAVPGTRPPVVQGDACPPSAPRSFNPFMGKTPAEIDAMLRSKGYVPKGPDPMSGRGNYYNPRSKRSYNLDSNHPLPKPPHVGVSRPRGYRGNLDTRDFFY
jgi:RHS repeat-associated protein